MKRKRTPVAGTRLRALLLLPLFLAPCSLCFSLLAQDTEPVATDAGAQSADIAAQTEGSADATTESTERRNLADIVNLQDPSTTRNGYAVPAHVPSVVAGYLPSRDTNVGIGISYPSGSAHFVYLVAGIRPPGGDPRLPPEEARAVQVVAAAPTVPDVIFEPAEIGSRAVMVRGGGDATIVFPPGAHLRGSRGVAGSSEPVARGTPQPGSRTALYYRQPTTTENGEDLIWNFPPGATLLRNSPASR